MAEVLTLLVIITLSMFVVRAGAIALKNTGMSMDSAMFQSQSAFMGVGFTTTEAEAVMGHPVRRRIIQLLMLLGFGAVTSTLGTLVVTFARSEQDSGVALSTKAVWMIGGLIVLWVGRQIRPFERLLDAVITRALESMTDLSIMDYAEVLKLDQGYAVAHVSVDEACWMAGHTLHDLELSNEGVLILSVTRASGTTLGTPTSSTRVLVGDRLLCYGIESVLANIANRPVGPLGKAQHDDAVREHRQREVEERALDQRSTNDSDSSDSAQSESRGSR